MLIKSSKHNYSKCKNQIIITLYNYHIIIGLYDLTELEVIHKILLKHHSKDNMH